MGASLSVNPHTWHLSLSSKEILAEKLDLLGSVFIQRVEGRTQPGSRKSLWRRDMWPEISKLFNPVSTVLKYWVRVTGLLQL